MGGGDGLGGVRPLGGGRIQIGGNQGVISHPLYSCHSSFPSSPNNEGRCVDRVSGVNAVASKPAPPPQQHCRATCLSIAHCHSSQNTHSASGAAGRPLWRPPCCSSPPSGPRAAFQCSDFTLLSVIQPSRSTAGCDLPCTTVAFAVGGGDQNALVKEGEPKRNAHDLRDSADTRPLTGAGSHS